MKGKLYHLSKHKNDGGLLTPRIPDNYFTKNGYEDKKTPRVCFAPTIDQCLMALSQKCEKMYLYVHEPVSDHKTKKPTVSQVPDSKITGELWVGHPVKLKCVGKIYVIGDANKPGIPFKYGKHNAELYDWNWKWVERYKPVTENIINYIKDIG